VWWVWYVRISVLAELDKDRFERLDDRSGVFRHDHGRNKSFSVLASKPLASMGLQRMNQQVSLVGQKMPRLNLPGSI
jgi:hypothetical protein